MPAAVVRSTGVMRTLGGRAGPTQQLTADDVGDQERLAREVNELRGKAAEQDRKHDPPWIDFEDVLCTSANTITLQHNFGGRVRWWVVDWTSTGTPLVDSRGDTLSVYSPMLVKTSATTTEKLVLQSYVGGTATIRVEKAG